MRNKFFIVLTAFFALFVLTACLPEAENLLSDPGASKLDKRLLGRWYSTSENRVVLVNIRETYGNKYEMEYTVVKQGLAKVETRVRYRIWTVKIGKDTYANIDALTSSWPLKVTPKRMIIRYQVRTDGTVAFAIMDEDKVKAVIKAGGLSGRIKSDNTSTAANLKWPIITATRTELVRYLRAHGPKSLFKDKLAVLHRLKPTPRPQD